MHTRKSGLCVSHWRQARDLLDEGVPPDKVMSGLKPLRRRADVGGF